MKQHSRLAKLKQQKQRKPATPGPNPQRGRAGGPRWVWVALALLLLAGAGTWAVLEFVIWNKVPPELVGTWEVQTGSLAGGTFEFSRDGALRMRHLKADVKWRVTVDGKTLQMTTHGAHTKEERTQGGVIQELTPHSLIIELEKGEALKMVRRR
jgi:hypothetical protein